MRKIKRQKAKSKRQKWEEGVIHNLLISFIPLSLFFTFAF
jgi:hypothetical protein